jgi:hypothetical protein
MGYFQTSHWCTLGIEIKEDEGHTQTINGQDNLGMCRPLESALRTVTALYSICVSSVTRTRSEA